ncbi:MAG TPA: multidrug efflux RND transporter permease subunit [Opitutaceae bacterium]|nr:multidrug efflux RND transporter permease subunit [Opitutaceae bacterium]
MSFVETFIRRPVATTLLTVAIALAGAIAFNQLPVSPLPQVDFPTISVSANLPGASAEVMAATVATPLERALGRIAGVTEITSRSSDSSTRVTLQFDLSRDIDGAAREVQAAINAARTLLPSSLTRNPTYRKVNPSDFPILIMALTSDTVSRGEMYDIASTILAQKISQVDGVGDVNVGGAALPAVRVTVDPDKLSAQGLSLATVRNAITRTNANLAKGFVEEGDQRWQVAANDQALKASDYLPMIISYRNNSPVTLSDVGKVEESVENTRNAGNFNGKPAVVLMITRQPDANIIETVDRIKALIPALRASIPKGVDMGVSADRSVTIRASLHEVEVTLGISVILVVLVVFMFLREARATLIPAIAVPVSLIGTFSVMYLAGFSLNNLSLMALTIATGFVVDDAIVVLENISRYVEQGMPRFQAALKGAREVAFTVFSVSLSLIAVFIPILLMSGILGRLFREFAITLGVAILVSMVISLTTTPMMCARLLRRHRKPYEPITGNLRPQQNRGVINWMLECYRKSLSWVLAHSALTLAILVVTIGLNVYLYKKIEKGFFPQQDIGLLWGGIQADQSTSFEAMREKVDAFAQIVSDDPAVESVNATTGGGRGGSSGNMFISLKPLSERKVSADAIVNRLRIKTAQVPGARLFIFPAQDIRIGGRESNSEYQYTLQADDYRELREWEPKIRAAMSNLPEITDVNTDKQDHGLETMLVYDREMLSRLGLTVAQVNSTLYDAFGQRQISTLYKTLNQYHVIMQVPPELAEGPDALKRVYVVGANGAQIPLSTFAHYETGNASLSVNHQGQFVADTISFNLAEGVSLSVAGAAIQRAVAELGVPITIRGSFEGTARVFQQSLRSQPYLILAAIIAVYIVLGILYESLIHPITILSTLPSAGLGAFLALMVCGKEFTVIALIGILLLIGIVKKNAIMMIDFAIEAERNQHLSPHDAIFQACMLRFRPIMMTTVAAMLGALPLAIGFGEGSELRQPLGISIVGGLLVSQALTLYTTPVVYLYFDRLRVWAKRRRERRIAAASGVQAPA